MKEVGLEDFISKKPFVMKENSVISVVLERPDQSIIN